MRTSPKDSSTEKDIPVSMLPEIDIEAPDYEPPVVEVRCKYCGSKFWWTEDAAADLLADHEAECAAINAAEWAAELGSGAFNDGDLDDY